MDDEKRMAGEYEITQSIWIGDKEVVFGINENNQEHPYFCAFYERNQNLGQYTGCMIGGDYAELVLLYAKRIVEQCMKLREAEQAVTVPRDTITSDMCNPIGYDVALLDKVVVIRPEVLRPEYQTAEHQLVYVIDGNGAEANPYGRDVYIRTLYTGKESRINRSDVLGEMKELPAWAKERQAVICAECKDSRKNEELQSR